MMKTQSVTDLRFESESLWVTHESNVGIRDEDRRLETESKGTVHVLPNDESDRLVRVLAELRGCLDAIVPGQFAKPLGSTEQNRVFVGFGEDKEEDDESERADPEEFVESPFPSICLSGESTLLLDRDISHEAE